MNINIIAKLVRILNCQFLIPIKNLNANYSFYKDLQMNYPEQMEMLFYVEKEFKIDIDDRELNGLVTVNDLVNCIENHVNYTFSSNPENGYRITRHRVASPLKDPLLFV
jgi:acyl carrier protein